MKYNVSRYTALDDIGIVNAPEIGAETRVSYSLAPWLFLGTIEQPAEASGLWNAENGASLGESGRDLQVRVDTALLSDGEAAPALTLGVTLEDDTVGTATATFVNQSYFKDLGHNHGQFMAADLVPDGEGNAAKKIKAISGVSAVIGGSAGNRFSVVALPEKASFTPLGCKSEFNCRPAFSKSVGIACGYQATAFVKKGRSDAAQLTVAAKHFNSGDGLPRLNGHVVTLLAETYKDDRLLDQRVVVGGYRPTVESPSGDGDDERTDTAEGMFTDCAIFV